MPFEGDIEALWTFVYFSYKSKYQAVGFIKYGPDGQTRKVVLPSQHPDKQKMLKLALGSTTMKSFNGQFMRVRLFSDPGSFKEDAIQVPQLEVVEGGTTIKAAEEGVTKHQSRELLEEYAISGWFQCDDSDQFLFRVTIHDESVNEGHRLLGDRVLFAEIDDQAARFSTYSYRNVHAQGKPSITKKVRKLTQRTWYFVYFGYSRPRRTARVFTQEEDAIHDLTFDAVNHYPTHKLLAYVGRDIYNKHRFKGTLGTINLILGDRAFTASTDFDQANPLDRNLLLFLSHTSIQLPHKTHG